MKLFLQFTLLFCVYLLPLLPVRCDEDNKIVRVRLESCPSCKLNRLKEVRAFVYEDFPKYENAEWKKIHGANPELLFLNEEDEVVERINLEKLNRQECNDLLLSRGFKPRADKEL